MTRMAHHEECGICHSDHMCEHRLPKVEPRPPSICPLCGEPINPLDEIETDRDRLMRAAPGCTTDGWIAHKSCVTKAGT
ncbi:MAG: hypothetical protein WC683_03030 [bacterium]